MTRGKKDDGTLKDSRKRPIFIHSDIDDMTELTPNDMRVYMHLARRADKSGTAWPSYQSMGDHCFGSVYKHRDTRRKIAIECIAALIKVKLIRKETRQDELGQQTNCYVLLDPPVTVESLPPVTVESQGSDSVVTPPCDSTITTPCDRGVTPPVTVESPEDHPCEDHPTEGTPLEDHPSSARARHELTEPQAAEDEDDDFMDAICKALKDEVSLKPTPHRKTRLKEFAKAHGPDTVIRGIMAASDAGGQTFAYVVKCIESQAEANTSTPAPVAVAGAYTAYAPSRPLFDAAQAREQARVARHALIESQHAPSADTLAFWKQVQRDVRLTMTPDHYAQIEESAIVGMDEQAVIIAIWDREIYRALLHPNAVKPLARAASHLAARELHLVCELWDEAGRVCEAGARPPAETEASQ